MADIDTVLTHLKQAYDHPDDGNLTYHLRAALDAAHDLKKYVRSIEDAKAAMMEAIRKGRGN